MLRDKTAGKTNRIVTAINGLFAILGTVIAAALKSDLSQYANWPRIQSVGAVLKDSAWLSQPVIIFASASLNELRAWIGSKTTWTTTQLLVDQYHEQLFSPDTKDPLHYHRVTLYKFVKWRFWFCKWPASGWLQPVIRSGYRTKKGIPWFRASLDNPGRAQGIAAKTFETGQVIKVNNLPNLNASTHVQDQDLITYAQKTFVDNKWLTKRLKKNKNNALSFVGVPIEVSGKPWGSLVVDSQALTITISDETQKTLLLLQKMLGKTVS